MCVSMLRIEQTPPMASRVGLNSYYFIVIFVINSNFTAEWIDCFSHAVNDQSYTSLIDIVIVF